MQLYIRQARREVCLEQLERQRFDAGLDLSLRQRFEVTQIKRAGVVERNPHLGTHPRLVQPIVHQPREVRFTQTSPLEPPGFGSCPRGHGAANRAADRVAGRVPRGVTVKRGDIYALEQQLREAARISGGTTIKGYSVVGTALLLAPAPSEVGSVIKITYYQRLPALSVSATTNWLLTAHPDLYLFGTLTVASAFLKDDERTGIWKNAWDEALGEVMAAGIKARQPATPLVMRSGVSE